MATLRFFLLAATIGVAAACSEGPSGPSGRIPVSSVTVHADTAPLTIGQTRRLIATPHAADGAVLPDREVRWSASDTTLATVAQDGTVRARGAGLVAIRASAEGRSGQVMLRILPPPPAVERVELTPGGQLSTRAGNAHQLVARAFAADGSEIAGRAAVWTSSDTSIVNVEPSGRIVARAIGNAVITARVDDRAAELVVQVATQVARIDLDPDTAVIAVGEVLPIYALPRDEGGNVVNRPSTWTSSNPAVASVVAPGRVTGHAPGTATITVMNEGVVAHATIVVAEWIERDLLVLNDSALPATLHTFSETDGSGALRTNHIVAHAGTLRVLPAGATGGRYEQRFDVMMWREGSPATAGQYRFAGSYTREPATGDLVFHDYAGRRLTGIRMPDGRVVVAGRLELAEGVVTPALIFVYAAR